MPKLATRLRQYSKLDSEGSTKSKRNSGGDSESLRLRGDLGHVDSTSNLDREQSQQQQPQCSYSMATWPKAPRSQRSRHLSTFSARSDAKAATTEEEEPESSSRSSVSSYHSRNTTRTTTSHEFSSVHRKIRQTLVKPFQDIKFRVRELQVQTRRKCRRLRLRADSFWGRTVEVALGPWQAVQGFLYGLFLVCLGIAEILFIGIIFTVLYKTLKVVVTTLLIPVIIVIAIVNVLKCQ